MKLSKEICEGIFLIVFRDNMNGAGTLRASTSFILFYFILFYSYRTKFHGTNIGNTQYLRNIFKIC